MYYNTIRKLHRIKDLTGTLQIIKEPLQLVELLREDPILLHLRLVLIQQVAEDHTNNLVLVIK